MYKVTLIVVLVWLAVVGGIIAMLEADFKEQSRKAMQPATCVVKPKVML